jgi:hypothetical protein
MDSLRGNFGHEAAFGDDARDCDPGEDDTGREAPPASIGTDERRMQVRAYNHWASLLQDHNFPSIEELAPEELPDFGPYSVLLDFTAGIENPGISYLGNELARECGTDADIANLADVPSRSLLSRITDHYMQILANQAPIGFEAEFMNQNGHTILYRGILLPFSSDDDTIDFIYGVINWKELADQFTTDELLLEIDQALEQQDNELPGLRTATPINDWADSPLGSSEEGDGEGDDDEEEVEDTLNLRSLIRISRSANRPILPSPGFGSFDEDPVAIQDPESHAHDMASAPEPASRYELQIVLPEQDETDMGLGDWLASARELAELARSSEDRTRQSLYAAIGRAYDFALAAVDAPQDFTELVTDYGLKVQPRAPMTPVVKLVFGADYDKTRLTEYAAALNHGQRLDRGRPEGCGIDRTPPAPGRKRKSGEGRRRAARKACTQIARTPRAADCCPLRRRPGIRAGNDSPPVRWRSDAAGRGRGRRRADRKGRTQADRLIRSLLSGTPELPYTISRSR